MRPARACLCAAALAVGALAALASPPAAAGTLADREAARELSGKAYEAFEARRWRRAIDLFQQAEARFHAPAHLLYTARALVKLHRFREAKVTLERVVAEKLPEGAPAPFREAQASARAELTEVEALTPNLVVTLSPTAPPGARVVVDGEPLAPGDLGRPLPRDPGEHALVLEAPGTAPVERKVMLTAGGADEHVTLAPAPPPPRWSATPAVISFSVGAAGLIAGTTGAVLLRHGSSTPLRVMEAGGFTVGALGVGTGSILIALWASAQPARAPASASLHVGVGVSSLHVGGRF